MTDELLINKLLAYSNNGRLPMHMPGHKRSDRFPYLSQLGAELDITEIDTFDDLNSPEDIFLRSEETAAMLWRSSMCLYSVNGSSSAILAGIRSALGCKTGKKVLMTRASHRSVYHAVELCGAHPVYLKQGLTEYGFCMSVDRGEVKKALDENPDTALVIVTSPTYEGVISDIRSIAEICHSHGVPLMVDEAHGAHLGLYGVFPDGAVRCGADIVVQSLHKTLPSLTQTALIHVNGSLIDREEVKRQMSIFQTSSPSYILSASIDGAVRYLSSFKGEETLRAWSDVVTKLRDDLAELKNLSLFGERDVIFAYDMSKIVLCGAGIALADYLRNEQHVEPEMAAASYVIAMTGAGDTAESLETFRKAVLAADAEVSVTDKIQLSEKMRLPRQSMIPSEAVSLKREECNIESAIGRVSAGYIYAYPPGIPLIAPGEVFDAETAVQIATLTDAGISLRGIKNGRVCTTCE